MRPYIWRYSIFAYILCFLLAGCGSDKSDDVIHFVTSADYPPFEYKIKGELVGFEIELAKMIANELGKKASFQDMQFSSVLLSVQSGMADAAISTITITEEREKTFDFSTSYHKDSLAMIFLKGNPILDRSQLKGKKIACQLGTTMDLWLKKHSKDSIVLRTDNSPQAIETLKAGHADGTLTDYMQAVSFTAMDPQLNYSIIAQADTGYAIAFKKHSALTQSVNQALSSLQEQGEIGKLKEKYFEIK